MSNVTDVQTEKKMGFEKKKKKKNRRVGRLTQDHHKLYEDSVQSPAEHIEFFDAAYSDLHGHPASSFKEDFCGTAILTAAWVAKRSDNTAIGVDLDQPTLDWGMSHNVEPLGKDASRVKLICADVMDVNKPKVDILAALNFSYFEFKTRERLRTYFESARKSLKPGGLFILDMFGGWEAQMEETDRTRNKGYTYVWQQTKYDPISQLTEFRIHFKFHGGGGIDDAFVYNWRLWTIPEVRELLTDAGFEHIDIHWEGTDEDTGEGNGEYTLVTEAENCPGWIAFIVAY